MRISYKKTVLAAALLAAALGSVTGCEPSERKVLESPYYKEVQEENEKLKKSAATIKSIIDAAM